MKIFRLRIQIALSYTFIAVAAVFSVYSLGFMTDFFILFMDGNDAMYNFYKELQILNNALFQTGVTALIMALFLKGFDLTRQKAGFFGTLYTLAILVVLGINARTIFSLNRYFNAEYAGIDFSALDGYVKSLFPFRLGMSLFILLIGISIALFFTAAVNYLLDRKKGVSDEK